METTCWRNNFKYNINFTFPIIWQYVICARGTSYHNTIRAPDVKRTKSELLCLPHCDRAIFKFTSLSIVRCIIMFNHPNFTEDSLSPIKLSTKQAPWWILSAASLAMFVSERAIRIHHYQNPSLDSIHWINPRGEMRTSLGLQSPHSRLNHMIGKPEEGTPPKDPESCEDTFT